MDQLNIIAVSISAILFLSREDSWLKQLFNISLLTFDGLWKHMLPSDGNGLNDPTLSDSSDVTKELSSWFLSTAPSTSTTTSIQHEQQIQLGKGVLAAAMTGCRILTLFTIGGYWNYNKYLAVLLYPD
jgi:hypothetical protein